MEESRLTVAGTFPSHFVRTEKSFDSPRKQSSLLSIASCGRWRNRTPTNGFGDHCSTTKLIARLTTLS